MESKIHMTFYEWTDNSHGFWRNLFRLLVRQFDRMRRLCYYLIVKGHAASNNESLWTKERG